MTKHPTFFCDIDGTIFKYRKFETYLDTDVEVLPGVAESMQNWFDSGAHIVLTTARPEALRAHTISELESHGIPYHQLVMGIGRAERYLINDSEEIGVKRAIAIPLDRNTGFNFKI